MTDAKPMTAEDIRVHAEYLNRHNPEEYDAQRPLFATIDALTAERDRLRKALRALYDEQNGPPLVARTPEWNAAMALAAAELNGEGGE